MSRRTKVIVSVILLLAGLGTYSYFGRIEYSRKLSPNGKYFEIVSIRPMYYLPLPIYGWGVHSDTDTFISIVDLEGNSYGEAPGGLVQSAALTWDSEAAYLPWAEWDLKD